jgi:hypothetical protein
LRFPFYEKPSQKPPTSLSLTCTTLKKTGENFSLQLTPKTFAVVKKHLSALFSTLIVCYLLLHFLFVIKTKEALFKQGAKTTQKNNFAVRTLLCREQLFDGCEVLQCRENN